MGAQFDKVSEPSFFSEKNNSKIHWCLGLKAVVGCISMPLSLPLFSLPTLKSFDLCPFLPTQSGVTN